MTRDSRNKRISHPRQTCSQSAASGCRPMDRPARRV